MTSPKRTLPGFPEKPSAAFKLKMQASPLGPVVDQAPDLTLHGVLDVVRGVEAYGRVVSGADHLTCVVDVGRGHEGLSFTVVSGADGFVFLPVGRKNQLSLNLWRRRSRSGTNLTFGFQVDLKGVSSALIHHMRRPQPGFIPEEQRDLVKNPNLRGQLTVPQSRFSEERSVRESDLSMVRDSLWVDSLILFWASQCSMSLVGAPSMARMTSPGHRLAADALLPGVTCREKQPIISTQSGLGAQTLKFRAHQEEKVRGFGPECTRPPPGPL